MYVDKKDIKRIHSLYNSYVFLNSLQTFLLDGNFLQTLPAELENMHQLSYLGLSFNEFTDIPEVLEKLTAVDRLCMAGNCVETLRLQALRRMPHIKHVDLRYPSYRSVSHSSGWFILGAR